MYVTGRLPLLLAVGAVPVVLLSIAGVDAWLAMVGWVLLCLIAALADAAAAPDPRRLTVMRRMPRRVLLGQPVVVELVLRNTGDRAVHGRVRDAWQPTAGAPAERPAIDIPPGEARAVPVPLLPRRRGELRS
ncbi:DUF58 domain-containing protein, partial [Microbacterium arthrosphaerae]